jgi:hypothetical protein
MIIFLEKRMTNLDIEFVLVPVVDSLPGLLGNTQLIYAGAGPVFQTYLKR